MRIALGIITWQDGLDNVQATVASAAALRVDALLVADGVIDGVPAGELGDTSPGIHESVSRCSAARNVVESRRWSSQSEKRTWLLEQAREQGCEWLVQIDADERLHNAALLRTYLEGWTADAFPLPFEVDPGVLLGATWKCLRAPAWPRVVAGGAYLEHVDGNTYCAVPPGNRAPMAETFENLDVYRSIVPWLSHHPDERPAERRAIRLGELEHDLEPPPHVPYYDTPSLRARPLLESAAVSDEQTTQQLYACPQCGARYITAGVCEQGHAPAAVVAVGEVSPDASPSPAGDPLGGTATVESPNSGAAAVDGAATDTAGAVAAEPAPAAEPVPAAVPATTTTDTVAESPAAPAEPAEPTPHEAALSSVEQAQAALETAAAALRAAGAGDAHA